MGSWGTGLYENDTSLDVKDSFEASYFDGESVQSITDRLIDDYVYGDPKEELLFWLALADTQWKMGVLQPNVKEKALFWIDKLLRMEDCSLKRKELEKLQMNLLSPQPPVKKKRKKSVNQNQWKVGDVFAYQLKSDLAKEKGLFGRYILIRKIDEAALNTGGIVPIVYIKITNDTQLPSDLNQYDQLEYVQTWFTKYEERFWPYNMRRFAEDIAEKSKIKYEVDEYGFLPQYRAQLWKIPKTLISAGLLYMGNLADAVPPAREFIPHSKDNICCVWWGKNGKDFETKILNRYCEHNLRQLSIYTNKNG